MGKSIGSLGREREPLDLEFDYFGRTLRIHPYASDEVEVEFLEAGRDIDMSVLDGLDLAKLDAMDSGTKREVAATISAAQHAGYEALTRALRRLIHPDDFETYWSLGAEKGQQVRDRMLDIKVITTAVVEATTDFPTGPPSASPGGPGTTPPSSEVVSYSQTRGASDFDRAMALERGRPDLQEFFVMEQEYREAAAREAREAAERDRQKLADADLT